MMTPIEKKAAEHRKKWKWSAFKAGEWIPDAGVLIASDPIPDGGPEMRNTRYDIIYTCCGKEGRLAHDRITQRISKGSLQCKSCGHKKGGMRRRKDKELKATEQTLLPNYGWIDPPWPKLSHVQLGYALDCDRGVFAK